MIRMSNPSRFFRMNKSSRRCAVSWLTRLPQLSESNRSFIDCEYTQLRRGQNSMPIPFASGQSCNQRVRKKLEPDPASNTLTSASLLKSVWLVSLLRGLRPSWCQPSFVAWLTTFKALGHVSSPQLLSPFACKSV